jgi:signal transduction histidine kinase/ActR/RegA family two-component response regulator
VSISLLRFSRGLTRLCGAFAIGVGAVALVGWAMDSEPLRALYAGGITIKANTAISLLLCGWSLVLLASPRRSLWLKLAGYFLALVVVAIGTATLSEHLWGWDLGIDQWLFTEASGAAATASPNRMGPPASVAFPLLGIALLLIDYRTRRGAAPAQMLAMVVILIALVPVLGYIFGIQQLFGIARYTGIALHTAIGLLGLATGILLARPDAGVMRLLLADNSGGLLLRRMIPGAILLPIVLDRLREAGQDAGLYDADFGRSLLVLGFIVAFSGLTWWTGMAVHGHAAARERAEAAEREMRERLVATLESERNARAMAERSSRMKDEFLATLSHELRTPLNAILGWVQLLLRGGISERDAARGLEAIDRNSRLQVQLIEDLLDMSRIESGNVRLDVREVDLPAVIDAALAAAAPSAAAKGLTLERQIDPAVRHVQGDPARLQQVLWNLVSNAVKFTPAGGRVVVSLQRSPGHIEIAVRDNGIGISPDFLDSVFDRFRQADGSTTRRYGGLGLGLSIARQLTELHGGSLMAESTGEGHGSTFTIRLPASVELQAAEPAPVLPASTDEAQAIQQAPPSLRGARVLVVDDQADACELLERVLRDCEADVTSATTVDEAIDWLERREFDVLVSDISMPHRDGYDLIRHVRAKHASLPAIAVTAFARTQDEARALTAGFNRYLPKPIAAERLVNAVAALVGRVASPREA